jgi:hypothetical protein
VARTNGNMVMSRWAEIGKKSSGGNSVKNI